MDKVLCGLYWIVGFGMVFFGFECDLGVLCVVIVDIVWVEY